MTVRSRPVGLPLWLLAPAALGALFVVLPRMRTPYIAGRGAGSGTIVHAAGFTDEMSLDVASSVRDNRSVALRMQYQGVPPGELRYKAATYDLFQDITWRASPKRELLRERGTLVFRIVPGQEVGSELEPDNMLQQAPHQRHTA